MARTLGQQFDRLTCHFVIEPVLHLLELGATPERLAWSLAAGLVIGINPLLGSTTVACLALAFVLRLNVLASQITQHIVAPIQIALVFVFLNLGDRVFHTGKLPMTREQLLHAMRYHPITTTRALWTWQWHALAVWALIALVLTPLLAYAFRPPLCCLLTSLQHKKAAREAAAAHTQATATQATESQA